MLPQGEGSSGMNNWTPANIATALTLYKQILGPAGGAFAQMGGTTTVEDLD